jgi:hypothetical protein
MAFAVAIASVAGSGPTSPSFSVESLQRKPFSVEYDSGITQAFRRLDE